MYYVVVVGKMSAKWSCEHHVSYTERSVLQMFFLKPLLLQQVDLLESDFEKVTFWIRLS